MDPDPDPVGPKTYESDGSGSAKDYLQFLEFFCYLDCFESIVAEIKSYELELGGECLLGEEVGGEGVVGQVQQQQALQALHLTRSV